MSGCRDNVEGFVGAVWIVNFLRIVRMQCVIRLLLFNL